MTEQKWIFKRDGVEEKVALERWAWGVIDKDGSELHQFDSDGIFHQFKEINQATAALFIMTGVDPEDGTFITRKRYDIVVSPDMKLIHFYRNIRTPETDGAFVKVYCFGYEKNLNGKNEKVLFWILPDDRVIISDTDDVELLNFNLLKGTKYDV